MRILFFIAGILIYTSSYSQTYSKLIEPFDLTDNIMRDMEVYEDNILISTQHTCDPDTTDNIKISCTGISKFDLDGNLVSSLLIDTLFPEGFNRLLAMDGNVFLAGHHHEDFLGRSIYLYRFSIKDLTLDTLYEITNLPVEVSNINGIIDDSEDIVLYGIINIDGESGINIRKINENGTTINNYKTKRVEFSNDCHDLQFTSEGNLIYANPFSSGVGAGAISGQQIMIIDTAFNKIDSLEFDGFIKDRSGNLRLLASSTGHIYCMTNGNPKEAILPSHGHINKLSADLDTLVWTVKLPFNNLINERRYRIHDFEEAKNGDILAAGRTWDASPNALQDQVNNTFNGFLVRLSPEGEIKYLRVYKIPHQQQEILPTGEFSIYHESSLWNIHELEDDRLILGGTATYDLLQLGPIIANEETQSFSWLMTVDENGCLDGEECQEVIVIDGELKNARAIFPIGTHWTYEYFPDPINPATIEHSYITYEVTDTITQNDTTIYIIENNRGLPVERMIQGDNEVWFWDNNLNDWQLTYDFDAMSSYETQFGTPNFTTNTTAVIDTVEFFTFGERGIVDIDKISIEDNGTIEGPLHLSILDRCGNLDGGLRLGLGLNLFDPFYQIGELRCFEQDTFFYNFNGMDNPPLACDSTWIDVLNHVDNHANIEVRIYPNPTNQTIYIEGIKFPTAYILYSIDGRLMESGFLNQNHITIEKKGIYILKLLENGKLYTTKVIRI